MPSTQSNQQLTVFDHVTRNRRVDDVTVRIWRLRRAARSDRLGEGAVVPVSETNVGNRICRGPSQPHARKYARSNFYYTAYPTVAVTAPRLVCESVPQMR
jgi:hypothetical protein